MTSPNQVSGVVHLQNFVGGKRYGGDFEPRFGLTISAPPFFDSCYPSNEKRWTTLTVHLWVWSFDTEKKHGGVEEATFTQFFDLHPEVHAPRKNRSPKISKHFFQVTHLVVPSGKNLAWAREVHIAWRRRADAPKQILEVRTPRPSQVDVEGLVLDGIFAFSKCELVCFFFRFPHSCHPVAVLLRLTCGKDGKKMHSMWFENVCRQNVEKPPIRCHSGFGSSLNDGMTWICLLSRR